MGSFAAEWHASRRASAGPAVEDDEVEEVESGHGTGQPVRRTPDDRGSHGAQTEQERARVPDRVLHGRARRWSRAVAVQHRVRCRLSAYATLDAVIGKEREIPLSSTAHSARPLEMAHRPVQRTRRLPDVRGDDRDRLTRIGPDRLAQPLRQPGHLGGGSPTTPRPRPWRASPFRRRHSSEGAVYVRSGQSRPTTARRAGFAAHSAHRDHCDRPSRPPAPDSVIGAKRRWLCSCSVLLGLALPRVAARGSI